MKICYVHEEYPEETNFGGIATYQKRLAENMAMIGHTVYVIARSLEKDSSTVENGVHIIRIFRPLNANTLDDYIDYRKKVCFTIEDLEKEESIDIIETPDWGAETIFYLKKQNRKIPVVVKLHTPLCVWQEYNKSGLSSEVNNAVLEWEKYCIENAEKVISCSQLLINKIITQHQIKLTNVEVVPNLADFNNFYLKEPFHQSNNVLYCGSIEERKGVLVLAEAINIILENETTKHLNFWFIGKDTFRNNRAISTIEYIKSIVKSKYHAHLKFFYQMPHEQLNDYMNKSCIGIVPSQFDNLPYVALEEISTRLPILISDNTGFSELMQKQCPEIFFKHDNIEELAHKIIQLYNNPEKTEIAEKCYKIIHDVFSNERIVTKMIEVYKEAQDEFRNR